MARSFDGSVGNLAAGDIAQVGGFEDSFDFSFPDIVFLSDFIQEADHEFFDVVDGVVDDIMESDFDFQLLDEDSAWLSIWVWNPMMVAFEAEASWISDSEISPTAAEMILNFGFRRDDFLQRMFESFQRALYVGAEDEV